MDSRHVVGRDRGGAVRLDEEEGLSIGIRLLAERLRLDVQPAHDVAQSGQLLGNDARESLGQPGGCRLGVIRIHALGHQGAGSQCLKGRPDLSEHRLAADPPHHVGDQRVVHGHVAVRPDGITGVPRGEPQQGGLAGHQRRKGRTEKRPFPLVPPEGEAVAGAPVVPLGPDIDRPELSQAEGRKEGREIRAQPEGIPGRLQVEVEIVRGGGAEGPVEGQPQRLGLPRLEHQGRPGGQFGIGEAAVVVVAQGQHQVERVAQGGLALHVAAELVEVVLLLVPAHDGAVGVGPRHQGVEAVGKALALTQAGGVLRLEHVEGGPVDDGNAGAQQIRAARIVPVAEGLEEPVAVQQPQLGVVVLSVYRLRRPHPGQPDHVRLAVPRRQYGGQVVGCPPVQTHFDTPGPGAVVARCQGGEIRSRVYRRLPQFPGLLLLRVGVFPLRPRVVLAETL